jgi:hypothetical protein
MGASGYEFRHSVSKCREGIDIEDWIRIFAVTHALLSENYGDEVYARTTKQIGSGASLSRASND